MKKLAITIYILVLLIFTQSCQDREKVLLKERISILETSIDILEIKERLIKLELKKCEELRENDKIK